MDHRSHIVFTIETKTGQTAITYGVKQTNMISTTENLPCAPRPVTLKEIESACKHLAEVRSTAETLMLKVEKKRQAILDDHADELNSLAHELTVARSSVALSVQYGRELFKRPKTQVFHGIEVGFQKERDKVEVPAEEVLISRIETMLKAKASTLVRSVKSVVAEAFKQLTAQEKQMLGCRTITGADAVVVRAQAKSDVEKYFAACSTSAETEA